MAACGGATGKPATPSGPPLHLAPATDLAQGAELSWIIDVEPRAIAAHAELLPAIDALMSRAQIAAWATDCCAKPRRAFRHVATARR